MIKSDGLYILKLYFDVRVNILILLFKKHC
jgi:hypothetical protein